jgi:hypothetical protein
MITETINHYYGHGELWLGPAVAGGMPSAFDTSVASIDTLDITLNADFIEHTSKRTSIAKKNLKVLRMITGTGKLTCSQHSADLLKKYLYGTKSTVAGGSFSSVAFAKNPAAVGDYLPLPGDRKKVSSLVITDSTGSPVTAALGTHYDADPDAGMIKIKDLTGLTQPLKASGTEAAGTQINIFQGQPPLQGLRFKGIDLANNNDIKVVEWGKIMISPAASWGLLNDGNEVNKYEIDFEILEDESNLTYPWGSYRE